MTVSEARPIRNASTSVTTQMNYFNGGSYFALTSETGQVTYWGPRWLAVTVWHDEHDHAFATPEDFQIDEPWHVGVVRCRECSQEYAVRQRVLWPRCRSCENAQRAAQQRARRARARTLAIACTVCGAPLSARRSSRKYCSSACRQRAHRQRGVDLEAM